MDSMAQFKEQQKLMWSGFSVLENMTGTAAPHLVKLAGVERGARVLDVACGSGVVALTSARLGATVTGVDLTPELITRARENASIAGLDASFVEADVEALPLPDAHFDIVLSQFGHMFAPRPELAIREMLRVLKPGGTLAFSTWPPELLVGRSFGLMSKYGPPPPPGMSPPVLWGDPQVVRERLAAGTRDLSFAREAMLFQILSPAHYRLFMERNFGPSARLMQFLQSSDPDRAEALRRETDELARQYFRDNTLRQDFLMTRAIKS
jgi:SAM-dependent methyltransferase